MNNFVAAFVLAAGALQAHAGTATASKPMPAGSHTLAVAQANHVLDAVNGILAVNPEFTTLISLGTLFIGAAVVFSLRRPEA